MKKKILFLSHDAFRTGAPLILLKFLEWLQQSHQDIQFDVLLKKEGPLAADFRKVAQTYLWEIPSKKTSQSLIARFSKRVMKNNPADTHRSDLLQTLKQNHYDLIYANTIASSDVLDVLLLEMPLPTVLHVHELEMAIDLYCDRKLFEKVKDRITCFIAVSKVVRENLLKNHQVPEAKIALVHPFAWASTEVVKPAEVLRQELGIPENAFIIGGSGTLEWRKGADVFVQGARQVIAEEVPDRTVYFVWLGGWFEERYRLQIQYDIDSLGLAGRVLLCGAQMNPADYFNLFDVFFMPSREDPFPLVAIENGMIGNPVICFDHQVGSAEFIDASCGAVVSYLDIRAAAAAILHFYKDAEALAQAQENIKKRAVTYTVENQGAKIVEAIQKCLN